jgi:RimJ/RimL family protein N-acetyltransferase
VSEPRIRRELRPGDYGAIIEMHGRLYAREYGNDSSFEAMVAASVTRAAMRGFPRERERLWVVESDGDFAGSLALTDEDGVTGMIRWVLLGPSLRGRGLGRTLVSEAVAEARELGYERVELETFSDLTTAAAIYRSHGFRLTGEEIGPRWGRDSVNYQHYLLDLTEVEAKPHARGAVASA